VLNGLFVHMTQAKNGLNIRMVGTDGHRLSMIDRVVDAKHAEESMIIPKKAMLELRRLLEEGSSGTELRLGFSKNHALFKRDGLVMVSKLIDAITRTTSRCCRRRTPRRSLWPRMSSCMP